jgi:hypothetical protein
MERTLVRVTQFGAIVEITTLYSVDVVNGIRDIAVSLFYGSSSNNNNMLCFGKCDPTRYECIA